MSDPISSQSLERLAKIAEQAQQAQESGGKGAGVQFEQAMEKAAQKSQTQGIDDPSRASQIDSTKATQDAAQAANDPQEKTRLVLEQDLETRIQQMPPEEKAAAQRKYEIEVAPLRRSEQVQYHAVRIEQTDRARVALERNATDLPESQWKDRLIDRLENFRSHQVDLDKFMQDYASGKEFSQQELLAMQIQTHQMAQSIELLSKTVEHTVGGMKTIFQTNV